MKKVKLGNLWIESKIVSENPNSDKRIKVRLNVKGVEKRPDKNDKSGATKYFKRKSGQFIYGKQNLHKGAFGIIPKELEGFESSSDIPAFDIINACLPEWIYYYFKQGNFYKELEKYSKGTGSKRIHPDKIAHLEIPLPSLPEQKQILKKIQSTEKEISQLSGNVSHDKTLLTKLKQSILQEAVQGKLVKQNPKDDPASELLKKIKKEKEKLIKEGKIKKGKPLSMIEEDEVPYELPKGWVWTKLGDVCELIMGQSPPSSSYNQKQNGLPFYQGKSDFGKVSPTPRVWCDNPKKIVIKSDILICVRAPVGPTNLCEEESCIGRGLAGLRPILFNFNYLLYFFKAIEPIFSKKGFGSTFTAITKKDLDNQIIPFPPLAEQKRIVAKVDSLMRFCDELELRIGANSKNSKNLMNSVLKEVFENSK